MHTGSEQVQAQPHWSAKYVGIPYLDNGRSSLKGLDCWGLIRLVFLDERNIELPSYGEISTSELLRVARMIQANIQNDSGIVTDENMPWVRIAERTPLQPFDVAYMTGTFREVEVNNAKQAHCAEVHVGVVTEITASGEPLILHTLPQHNAVIVPASHMSIRHRIRGFCRYGQYPR